MKLSEYDLRRLLDAGTELYNSKTGEVMYFVYYVDEYSWPHAQPYFCGYDDFGREVEWPETDTEMV